MWKPTNILISTLMIVDTFFVSYAFGLNSRHVKVVDPSLARTAVATTTVATATPTTAPPVDPGKFADIASTDKRLQPSIKKAAEAGIIDPTADKKFRPNDPVTRGDFTRWMGRVRQVALTAPETPTYTDVDPFNPYYRDIEGATKSYLVQGYNVKGQPQKEFKPDQYITREEFAVLYGTFSGKRGRAEKLAPKEIDEYLTFDPITGRNGTHSYKDVGDVNDWAKKWVAVAQQAGVLEECFDVNPNTTTEEKRYFRPQQRMTRAEAVAILVKLYGVHIRTPEDIANILEGQGQYYERPGLYKEAEAMYQNALVLKKKSLGETNPQTAATMNKLAALYETMGDYAKAEPLYKQCIAMGGKNVDSEEVARSMDGLSIVYKLQGKFADAEQLYKQLLARDEKLSGATSAAVANDLENLARIYAAQNKKDEAQKAQARATEIMKGLPGAQRLASLPARSALAAPPAATAVRPVKDKWALVVGISKFKDPSINLKYAAKDAADFRQYLITEEGFAPDHVKLLTDAQATRENIIGNLGDKWLGRLANPDDLVVVYVSSHGTTAKEDVGVNFLLANDTNKNSLIGTGIPMQWLSKMIQEQVHSDRVLLVLDVCHAGSAAGGDKDLNRQRGFDVDKVAIGTGQAVLCSSLADQVSWESKNYQNSVFTRHLMEAFRARGNQTRLQEAYDVLRDKVQEEVLRDRYEMQTPTLKKAWQGDDLVLAVKAGSPRPGIADAGKSGK